MLKISPFRDIFKVSLTKFVPIIYFKMRINTREFKKSQKIQKKCRKYVLKLFLKKQTLLIISDWKTLATRG